MRRWDFITYYEQAERFLVAAAITNNVISNAINYLVGELLKNNLWNKCYAVYPIVGGTASTHKFNLINPQDTDAAYRLNFVGGITHSSNGMQGNGTTGYANTFFNPTTAGVSINNFGFGVHSRTNQARLEVDMGARNAVNTGVSMLLIRDNNNISQHQINNNLAGTITQASITNSAGNFGQNRTASNVIRICRNGTFTQFTQASGGLTNRNIALMALLTNATYGSFSSKQYTFFRIHQGLTDAEETIFQNIITNFNTLLGR